MTSVRIAGLWLLLTALVTAGAVVFRLMVGADQPTMAASLAAIGTLRGLYALGGGLRLLSGLTLMAAAWQGRSAVILWHPRVGRVVVTLLVVSGIATAVSGTGAVALSAALPATVSQAPEAQVDLQRLTGVVDLRRLAGVWGFGLCGLALVALAPVSWRGNGWGKGYAVGTAGIGVAMLFIWIDDTPAALHAITGVAFLLWLIASGVWLATGAPSPPKRETADHARPLPPA